MGDHSTTFWIWNVATLLMAATLSFAAGWWCARFSLHWSLRQSRRHALHAFQTVLRTFQTAQTACDLLARHTSHLLSEAQVDQLKASREKLAASALTLINRQAALMETAAKQPATPPRRLKRKPMRMQWSIPPQADPPASGVDAKSDSLLSRLPGRAAFQENLELLLKASRDHQRECGLLLIKTDKVDQLRQRFGATAVDHFLRSMAFAACQSVRDEDLVCRFATDTFAVLMPDVSASEGRTLAESIRNTIRHHKFRLDAGGAEVLVTASFGYSPCLPHDNDGLVMNRAGDALARSQKRGRNQLHVYQNGRLTHCAVG